VTALELAVHTWGEDGATRRALVMHGIGSNAAGWWRLGPDLASLGYHVTAPDLRGHGNSPKAESMTIPEYAGDALALGDHWDLILGHSLGGAIALQAISSRPDLTDRLILQDPAIMGVNSPEVVELLLSDYEEPITAESVHARSPQWHSRDAEIKAEALRQSGPDVVLRTIRDGPAWNYWDEMLGLEIPVLLIGADPAMGALVQPSVGEAAAAANPNLRFEVVEHGSHSMHRDRYEDYWALVGEFAR
jgi:pimeloyl-ACP methyl ester carboxylesterase